MEFLFLPVSQQAIIGDKNKIIFSRNVAYTTSQYQWCHSTEAHTLTHTWARQWVPFSNLIGYEHFNRISFSQFKLPEKILMTHNSCSIHLKLGQLVCVVHFARVCVAESNRARVREQERAVKIILAISIWFKCVGLVTRHHSPLAAIAISDMKHSFVAYGRP